MPYVHLANGDVRKLNADELTKAFGDESPRVLRDNGTEYHVIGVYPDEVEYDTSVDEATQRENDDRAEFEAWKAEKNKENAE
jgi:hypothetical protein